MVPIFLLAISFLTAMRIWFSLGTFVNLLETKADRNHLFPRARRSPPQTRSSSFDLPWGIFATICSTKALRSNKWAGETPYNHKVRMKQQTSLKPCHISCQGSLFGVSFVCSAWLQTRAKANPFKTMTLKNILNIFGITMIPCLNIEVCWKPLFDTPNEPDHIPDPAVTGCGGMCSTCLWPSEHSSDPGITSSYSRFISSINKTAPHWRPGQTAFNWQAIGGCWYILTYIIPILMEMAIHNLTNLKVCPGRPHEVPTFVGLRLAGSRSCIPPAKPTSPRRKKIHMIRCSKCWKAGHDLWVSWDATTMTGWWFEPLWKILVNWDDYSQYMGK